jgi:polygalacturonase
MDALRREFLKMSTGGVGAAIVSAVTPGAQTHTVSSTGTRARDVLDVRNYGAKGDGVTIDTPAFNQAIEEASRNGGGTVRVSAGVYPCYSIHLKNYVYLYLEPGATILAADFTKGQSSGGYDPPEPNSPADAYQDFGHGHWHNSLIWGDGIHDCGVIGPGLIWGRGLVHDDIERSKPPIPGIGNKTIALKNCHNVILRDFSILSGGHFGILATGTDNLTIDNLKIDTNRDGMNIDCCRNVRVSNCSVNSPTDDGICLKSSFGLGYARATENVTITNCYVSSAWRIGTMLDATWKRFPKDTKENGTGGGRIKFGTESNGGFINITVSNCVFDGCEGLAIESVDGAIVEDISVTNITIRDCLNPPIFLRLGSRLRGPEGTQIGRMRRILISNIVSYNSVGLFGGGGVISGIPDHPIEDVKISNIYVNHRGVGTKEMAAVTPPENLKRGPEAHMFGDIPASGFFVRHVNNIEFNHVEVAWSEPDVRPVFWLQNVEGADFFQIKSPKDLTAPVFSLHDVKDFSVTSSRHVKDVQLDSVDKRDL